MLALRCPQPPCRPAALPCPQEYLLHLLLQPRQRYTELEQEAWDEEEEEAEGGDDAEDMHRSKSGAYARVEGGRGVLRRRSNV